MHIQSRHSLTLPLIGLLLALLLTACASPQRLLQEPTFRLAGVEPIAIGMMEQQFRLTIRVDNPNNLSLPVQSLRYKVRLANMDFASGATTRSFTLPARDSTTFEVDVTTSLMTALPKLLGIINSRAEAVDYALSGDVEYGRFFRGNQAFEQKGQLQLAF